MNDGKCVVSGSDNKTVRIWDVGSGQTVSCSFEGHTNAVTSITFSRDGKRVVSGLYDKTVRIWDVETGQTDMGPQRARGGGNGIWTRTGDTAGAVTGDGGGVGAATRGMEAVMGGAAMDRASGAWVRTWVVRCRRRCQP